METLQIQQKGINALDKLPQIQQSLLNIIQIITSRQIKKGMICLVNSHICKVIEVSMSKPGKHGMTKFLIKGLDIFLGNFQEQIFRQSQTLPKFNITKSTYIFLQGPNQDGIITGLSKDEVQSVIQISLNIELFESQENLSILNENNFKLQNYIKLDEIKKGKRVQFIQKVCQLLSEQDNSELCFDVIQCCGYRAIIGFTKNQKQIRISDFCRQFQKLKNESSQNQIAKNIQCYPKNENNLLMVETMKNLLNHELSSIKLNQNKKKQAIFNKEVGIQSEAHQRLNQLKQACIQKLTLQFDQIQIYQKTIKHQHVEQLYKHFLCPISSEIMKKPVILASCGHTFDKEMITKWIRQKTKACPICIKTTTLKDIIPNFILTDLIATFLQVAKSQNQKNEVKM